MLSRVSPKNFRKSTTSIEELVSTVLIDEKKKSFRKVRLAS